MELNASYLVLHWDLYQGDASAPRVARQALPFLADEPFVPGLPLGVGRLVINSINVRKG